MARRYRAGSPAGKTRESERKNCGPPGAGPVLFQPAICNGVNALARRLVVKEIGRARFRTGRGVKSRCNYGERQSFMFRRTNAPTPRPETSSNKLDGSGTAEEFTVAEYAALASGAGPRSAAPGLAGFWSK